jgi:diketogulonate reductase-like aldo/keto reductase
VPWSPLGQGFLTGTMDASKRFDPETAFRSKFPRMSPENLAKNAPFVDLLRRVAAEKEATPGQIGLAWLLAMKPWIVPIPGTRRADHLDENVGASNVDWTSEQLTEINTELAKLTVFGLRMDEDNMKVVEERVGCDRSPDRESRLRFTSCAAIANPRLRFLGDAAPVRPDRLVPERTA